MKGQETIDKLWGMWRASSVLLPFLLTSAGGKYYCPDGGFLSSGKDKCFFFVNQTFNFDGAQFWCATIRGQLTSIHNGFDNSLISRENFVDHKGVY